MTPPIELRAPASVGPSVIIGGDIAMQQVGSHRTWLRYLVIPC